MVNRDIPQNRNSFYWGVLRIDITDTDGIKMDVVLKKGIDSVT